MQEILNFLRDAFYAIISYVLEALKQFFEWILEFFLESIDLLLTPVIDLVPDLSGYWASVNTIVPYLFHASCWVDLTTLSILATAYFVFILAMIVVKLVIKLFIPTVG